MFLFALFVLDDCVASVAVVVDCDGKEGDELEPDGAVLLFTIRP